MVVTIFAKIALMDQWVKHNARFICRNTKKISKSQWRGLSLRSNCKPMATVGFSERIYLQYLRTKFKTISKLAPATAGRMAFELFCTPYPKYKKRKAPAIFHHATKRMVVLTNQTKIHGFEWLPNKPNDQTVLIAHGYASYAYKFEHYIAPLLKMGYRVLAFDAPAHGQSEGKHIHVVVYQEAIQKIMEHIGPIHHFIGHSLGALTLSMIAENIDEAEARKFVLIAPATKTTTTFANFFKMMHLNEVTKAAFLQDVSNRTHHSVEYFAADRALTNYHGPLLWVHDEKDVVCPYEDIINFKEKAPSNIKFLITNGLGHNKVYKTAEVMDQIMAFLTPSK
jgi:pimeloyl-ACP methyl ester carboxylesterase